ncbi:hypothetical protein B1813_13550 [Saccharomonospora piscinae]|uniref:Uncharacterized protein n=1 Tax=Saccharomonospora piscinae TaxID=687388 RepID=A0A1V9A093_SACPI|nr:hypothetical protein B1813_13550 [Saccharomonospora piscinae]
MRAVRFLAVNAGLTQFLDCGLPGHCGEHAPDRAALPPRVHGGLRGWSRPTSSTPVACWGTAP